MAIEGSNSGTKRLKAIRVRFTRKVSMKRRSSGLVRGTLSWNALYMHITIVLQHNEMISHVPRTVLPDTQRPSTTGTDGSVIKG